MKQHKTLNINLKLTLNRIPTMEEKLYIVESLKIVTDMNYGLYNPLRVTRYKKTIRKMGF